VLLSTEIRANGKSGISARCTCGAFADEISAHPKISNDIGEVFFRLALISWRVFLSFISHYTFFDISNQISC
jgi:hypothetical protein